MIFRWEDVYALTKKIALKVPNPINGVIVDSFANLPVIGELYDYYRVRTSGGKDTLYHYDPDGDRYIFSGGDVPGVEIFLIPPQPAGFLEVDIVNADLFVNLNGVFEEAEVNAIDFTFDSASGAITYVGEFPAEFYYESESAIGLDSIVGTTVTVITRRNGDQIPRRIGSYVFNFFENLFTPSAKQKLILNPGDTIDVQVTSDSDNSTINYFYLRISLEFKKIV